MQTSRGNQPTGAQFENTLEQELTYVGPLGRNARDNASLHNLGMQGAGVPQVAKEQDQLQADLLQDNNQMKTAK